MSASPKESASILKLKPARRVRGRTRMRREGNPEPGEVLTAGSVAALLRVSSRTSAKWVDSGQLRGYRLPGTSDRRVHAADLVEFALANGMLRLLAEVVVSDGGTLLRARVHDRWGTAVARVAPEGSPPEGGVDWLPGAESPYVLKAAAPEAFRVLVDARLRFADGR